jgi:dTDP-4-amino-4,6-dideoxygalactose transaminase
MLRPSHLFLREEASNVNDLALFGGTPVRSAPWPRPRMIDHNAIVRDLINQALHEGLTLFTSKRVSMLEQRLGEIFQKRYAAAVSSGTAALETALYALGIHAASDEVIVPAATYVSSASAIKRNGAKPVFVDCDNSFTLSPNAVQQAITSQTRAVIFVSLFGNPGNLAEVYELCQRHNIPFVHDCAQGAASKHNGQWIAYLGDIVCLSFFETKHLAGGEGGAILTDREEIYTRAKGFSNLFEVRNDGIPTAIEADFRLPVSYPEVGTNYRLSALAAVLVSYAVDHLEETQDICLRNGKFYLQKLQKWGTFPRVNTNDEIGWYGVPILLRKEHIRDGFWKALHCEGTPIARYYYTCLPENAAFGGSSQIYPVTKSLVANALILPTHKAIGPDEQEDLVKSFTKIGGVLCPTC